MDEATAPGVSVLTVVATDADNGENKRLTYSMLEQQAFYIEPVSGMRSKKSFYKLLVKMSTYDKVVKYAMNRDGNLAYLFLGTIYTNLDVVYTAGNPTVNLVVMATDHGVPNRTAVVPVQIQVIDINNNEPRFSRSLYR